MTHSRREQLIIGTALLYPTLLTWVYFVVLRHSATGVQQAAYSVGKLLQFALPVLWLMWFHGERFGEWRPTGRGVASGLAFGAIVGLAMLGLYHGWISDAVWFEHARQAIHAKVAGLGINSPARFIAVGLFYALIHSAAEEFYWRWFVFGRLRQKMPLSGANTVSSVAFMSHHVILLATFFGVTHPATWIFSASVGLGGMVWAWLYQRSGQIYGPWLSHLLVDAAIFAVGYSIAADVFR